MKGKQFVRRLRKAGARIATRRGKGGHYLVTYRGRQTTVPVHGGRDISPALMRKICKQLGMKAGDVL